MEEYLKRNEFKPERSHIKRNFTPYDRLLLTDKIENNSNFIRSNRCKLREQQEEKYKNPRPQSKKINQPNISNNMNSILKNNLNYNNNYRSIRRTNYKTNNFDNAYDIIFPKNNNNNNQSNNIKTQKIPMIKRLKRDHIKDLMPINNYDNEIKKNEKKYPINPNKVPYEILIEGIKENQKILYTYS